MLRSFLTLWLTLAAAILALCVLAQLWVVQRRDMAQQRVHDVLAAQLRPINESIARVIDGYSIALQSDLTQLDITRLEECVAIKRLPLADTVVVVDAQSRLFFPDYLENESTDRLSLIDEAQQLLREQIVVFPTPRSSLMSQATSSTAVPGALQSSLSAEQLIQSDNDALEQSLLSLEDEMQSSFNGQSTLPFSPNPAAEPLGITQSNLDRPENVPPVNSALPGKTQSANQQAKVYYGNRMNAGNLSFPPSPQQRGVTSGISDERSPGYSDDSGLQPDDLNRADFKAEDAGTQYSDAENFGDENSGAERSKLPADSSTPDDLTLQRPFEGSADDANASLSLEHLGAPELAAANEMGDSDRENSAQIASSVGQEDFGWLTWYHRRGMVLGFWWKQSNQWRGIVALPRSRWMADIVAALPSSTLDWSDSTKAGFDREKVTDHTGLLEAGRLVGTWKQLVDVEGTVIYQWGDAPEAFQAETDRRLPTAEVPVAEPLEGWRLRVYATDTLRRQLAGDNLVYPIWLAVGGVASSLVLGGVFATLNMRRQIRLAASRVSFVNQVSHELRTPLTNIRMYADLLSEEMGERNSSDPLHSSQIGKVEVIQSESQRLSRLISNVLEFARLDRKQKPLQKVPLVVDRLVEECMSTFKPRLDELGFELNLDLTCQEPRYVDGGALEQIVVNLIGNAEKYAADGRYLGIATCGDSQAMTLVVEDAGPGISKGLARRMFRPFERGSDRLENPAGTGIGLTIVREIARRHGGDCVFEAGDRGAKFVVTLNAPRVRSDTEELTGELE